MNTCKKCGEDREDCECEDGGSFIVSAVVGHVTNSALIGGLVGGDLLGGIFGDGIDGSLMD